MNARTLRLTLSAAILAVFIQPLFAQDAAADKAKELLKQGLEQYKAMDFTEAKATLLKVDPAAISDDADKKALEDRLAKVDEMIKKQAQAREALAAAEKALADNDLAKAREGYAAAAASDVLPDADRKDAKAQLALVDKKLKASTSNDVAATTPAVPSSSEIPALTTAPVAVTTTTKPAPVDVVATTTTTDDQRALKAKQLVTQGKAAMDKKQPDVAANYFEQALALDPGNKETQQLLDQARSQVATVAVPAPPPAGTVESPLQRLEQERAVVRQARLLDFAKGMQRSRELLTGADTGAAFDASADAARGARRDIEDARTYFTDKEYRERIAEADEQIRFVSSRKDVWERQRAAREQAKAEEINAKRLAALEEQRRSRVGTLVQRAQTLEEQQKYREALEVLDQVLVLEPQNSYIMGKRDALQKFDLLRQEGHLFKTMSVEWEKQANGTREAEIPWYEEFRYPTDWREITVRRQDITAIAASETEEARITRQKLQARIPRLDFTGVEFKDVVEFFRTASGAKLDPSYGALQAAGVDKATQVDLVLTDVTVQAALERVLEKLSINTKIGYTINKYGIVIISTKDDLAKETPVRVYDIRDLIVNVPNFAAPTLDLSQAANNTNGGSGGGGGGIFSNNTGGNNNGGVENIKTRTELVTDIMDTIKASISPDSWQPAGTIGSIREMNGTLVVKQTAENHEALVDLIQQLRETRTLQISVEARFIQVSSGFLDSVGMDLDLYFNIGSGLGGGNPGGVAPPGGGNGFITDPWTGAKVPTHGTSAWGSGKPGDNKVTPIGVIQQGPQSAIGFGNMIGVSSPIPGSIGNQVTTPALSIGGTFLDDVQVNFLVQATQANSTSRTLTAPRVTLFNGQRANIVVAKQVAYVASFTPVVSENIAALTPTISTVQTGAALDVEATVSADRRYVTMTLQPWVSTINGITPFSTGPGGGTVQLPDITTQKVQATVNVPDGGTVLLGGQRLAAEIEHEGGIPILSKIPVINRFVTNRGKIRDESTLLILVKPKIIIPREIEEIKFPPTR